jgi:ComF family protein
MRHAMLPIAGGWFRGAVQAAADFMYPPSCPLCGAETGCPAARAAQAGFCSRCWRELLVSRGPACLRCGASIGPNLDPQRPCSMCRDERFAFARVFRVGVYDALLRQACLRGKERHAEPLPAALGETLWNCESANLRPAEIDLIVPIPHHWTQRFTRTHNPAETIGEVLSRRLRVPHAPSILKKVRRTLPQAKLAPSVRRTNLRNALAVPRGISLAGATVLVTDDVMTTGATAHEAARVLMAAGAERVLVAVVARGLGRRHGAGNLNAPTS